MKFCAGVVDACPMTKTLMKRMLLLSAFSVGALLLLAMGLSRGILSPRGLGFAMLILCMAITGFVLISRTTAKGGQLKVLSPIDAATRKRLTWRIRAAKTMIALMALGLVGALNEARNFSTWGPDRRLTASALLVGLVMNLLITTVSVKTVVRLQRILKSESCDSL
jgi:hypothetical protein